MSTTTEGTNEYALAPHEQERVEAVTSTAAAAVASARALSVGTRVEAEHAAEVLRRIKGEMNRHDAAREAVCGPLYKHWRFLSDGFKAPRLLLDEADRLVRGKLIAYNRDREAERIAEQARFNAEAAERRRADEQAHAESVAEAERARLAWAERAAEAQRVAEQEPSIAAALAADAASAAHAAMMALREARKVTPLLAHRTPVAPVDKPVDKGVVSKRRWDFELTGTDLIPREFMAPDMKAIRSAMHAGVRANGQPPEIPGVRFVQVDELQVHGR